MDRRQFLRAALSLAPAAIILPPAVKYFLPPPGGWARFSGYNFLVPVFDEDMAQLLPVGKARAMERVINPPLVMWGDHAVESSFDLQALGSAVLRTIPGAVHRVPPHKWHTLEVDHG